MVYLFLFFTMFCVGLAVFQYSLIITGVIKDDISGFGRFVAWIPLLPFVIGFIYFIYFMFRKINEFFEVNFGWFFINGRKRSEWAQYLREKYNK